MTPIASLRGPAAALFASDMHLGAHDPGTAQQFLAALEQAVDRVSHLFILGDALEAWVGDDQPDPVAAALADTLARLARYGLWIGLMRGNRDFLIDVPIPQTETFSRRCGAQLLDDTVLIDWGGESVLLAHGDAWCLSDQAYQAFRAQVRAPAWQQQFLARPLAERLAIARSMRQESEARRMITDIDQAHAAALMRASGVSRLIHGHTHQPGESRLPPEQDGSPLRRWVLPDWSAAEQRGGFLRVDAQGWHWLDAR